MSRSPEAPIDLRSDTVTEPTEAMRRAMGEADVGDDVYEEDPTVAKLEELAAGMLGHDAALFFPTGTMANQVAIHLQTEPGEEVLIEATGHSVDWELGGMAVLSGVQPRTVAGVDGILPLEALGEELGPRSEFRSRVGLAIVENTHNMSGGRIVPLETMREIHELCRDHGVPVHLDGARLFNAAVGLGVPVADLAACCDTVMVSLSKGLCAPIGSLLAGPAGLIGEARRVRKLFGGGMRQVGVIAAAGIVALETMVDRLADDHANARALADGLVATGKVELAHGHVDSNIVVVDAKGSGLTPAEFCARAEAAGVLCFATGPREVRFVTHHDVSAGAIDRAVEILARMLAAESVEE